MNLTDSQIKFLTWVYDTFGGVKVGYNYVVCYDTEVIDASEISEYVHVYDFNELYFILDENRGSFDSIFEFNESCQTLLNNILKHKYLIFVEYHHTVDNSVIKLVDSCHRVPFVPEKK